MGGFKVIKKEEIVELIIMQIPVVIGFIWWAAGERAKVYVSIDSLKDGLKDLINQLDKRVDLHIQDSHSARDSLAEKITGQGKRFGAKLDRIERYIELLIKRKIEGQDE